MRVLSGLLINKNLAKEINDFYLFFTLSLYNSFDIFNDIFNDNDFPGMGGFPGVNIRMGGPFGSGFSNVHIRRQLGDTVIKIGITLEEVMKGCSKEVIEERDLNG